MYARVEYVLVMCFSLACCVNLRGVPGVPLRRCPRGAASAVSPGCRFGGVPGVPLRRCPRGAASAVSPGCRFGGVPGAFPYLKGETLVKGRQTNKQANKLFISYCIDLLTAWRRPLQKEKPQKISWVLEIQRSCCCVLSSKDDEPPSISVHPDGSAKLVEN